MGVKKREANTKNSLFKYKKLHTKMKGGFNYEKEL